MSNPTPLFAGIDLGTSGVRGVCVDEHLNTVAEASLPFKARADNRRDPELWWRAVRHIITHLLSQIDAAQVVSLAVDGTSGSMLAVDASGAALGSALLYNDPCEDQRILDGIAQVAPDTSAVHGATSALARAISLSNRYKDTAIAHEADWIAGRLSGLPGISDENNALKTGYDPVNREWPRWIESTGIRRKQLPRVLAAGQRIGRISNAAAQSTGLHKHTLIVTGTTDGCASFLATGAARPGDGVSVLGSTLTIKLLSETPIYSPQFGIYSHRIGNRWLAGGASNTGGHVLASYFKPPQLEQLSAQIDTTCVSGLDYYPLVTPGERFPVNDSHYAPRLTPRPTSDVEFLKGMLEGMATIEAMAYVRLRELGAPALQSIRTVGGGSANQAWTALRQQRLNVPFASNISDQAAVGTASLARDGYLHEYDAI